MNWMILICVLLTPLLLCERRHAGLRILYGVADTNHKYPFIVALVSELRRQCSGTLISSEWVLTAAHCLGCEDCISTHIQYGNMTIFPNETRTKNKILQRIRHPGFRDKQLLNDIALLRVEPVSMKLFGKLSAIDYNSLTGLAVEYAGFGSTQNNNDDDDRQPLLIGEGVVRTCLDLYDNYNMPGSFLCVAPKCSNKHGDSAPGDSGGPVLYDRKIIGIVTSGIDPIGICTSVSPYITWITEMMDSPKYIRRYKSYYYT